MPTPPDAQARTARTYNAAADFYDHPANTFWERFGRNTVARLRLAPGARVLDVCCGSGASALPAAETVGPAGAVLGVDLAEHLLELARAKARSQGLANVTFRPGDMLDLGLPDAAFDAVVCVFGIFFVPDMPAAVRELWRRVRPGGQLAITTWGPRVFEPGNSLFWEAIRAVRPDLYKSFNPWDRISDPASVRALLAEGGVAASDIVAEPGSQTLQSPDDWWPIVMGSGYRGTFEQLTPEEQEHVREVNLAAIRREGISAVETNVVYAVARKEP
jgi:ubiquinone/menaquinone biosynthesis C-methylase UbiE